MKKSLIALLISLFLAVFNSAHAHNGEHNFDISKIMNEDCASSCGKYILSTEEFLKMIEHIKEKPEFFETYPEGSASKILRETLKE